MGTLTNAVAVVAGATRGAGRGIAVALGEAGATVFCTGRSSAATGPPATGVYAGRPETVDETARLVDAAGGRGIPMQIDHGVEADVATLAERLRGAASPLDLVVMNFWGDDAPVAFGAAFVDVPEPAARATIEGTLWPHVRTLRALVPLLRPSSEDHRPLIVEVAEGVDLYYRGQLYYDLASILRLRLTFSLGEELAPRGIPVVGVCPGYMRTEYALDRMCVTEASWREAKTSDPGWRHSESPRLVGRAVAALAADPEVGRWSGRTTGSWELARHYGLTDIDGALPDFGAYFAGQYGDAPMPSRTGVRWRVHAASSPAERRAS